MSVARAILIVDHGSRLPAANEQLERVAERLRTRLAQRDDPTPVHIAHLEAASPDFAQGLAACLAEDPREIVIHPFFLAPGRHGTHDIPTLVESARDRHPEIAFVVTGLVGEGDTLAEVVLARVDEVSSDPDRG